VEDLRGQNAAYNAAVVHRVLAGEAGPVRDAVLLNAAAGLVAFDRAADGPLADRLGQAAVLAARAIDDGAAAAVLKAWISSTAG
jgi:anthranilate phosphoribosyltransferase